MSSPAEFYNSLPPISKAYGTLCLLFTTASQFGLIHPAYIALIYKRVFTSLEVWRLITNFFFLGPFSINFGIRLLMIARYGVQLENGPFQRRTADFLWMMMFGAFTLLALSAIPWFRTPFLGVSLVFMLLYVWSREFPNANISIYGLVTLKAFYLPWAMLAMDVIFGSKLIPDLLGIIAGHMYYFLTVLYPLSSEINILKTPMWVFSILGYSNQSLNSFVSSFALIPFIGQGMPMQFHLFKWRTWKVVFVLLQIFLTLHRYKLVRRWRIGAPTNPRVQPDTTTGGAFRGRSYRTGG